MIEVELFFRLKPFSKRWRSLTQNRLNEFHSCAEIIFISYLGHGISSSGSIFSFHSKITFFWFYRAPLMTTLRQKKHGAPEP